MMILKSIILLFCSLTSTISGATVKYQFNELMGGWLKMHATPATWDDAWSKCISEDAVLASPVNVQLRDAVKGYITEVHASVSEIFTGVQADLSSGDFISLEGVPLSDMPVIISAAEATVNYEGSESCVAWKNRDGEVRHLKCSDKLPFVCYKKRTALKVATCGNANLGYTYEYRTDSCYKFYQVDLTWIEAFKTCNKQGGYLAVINNAQEQQVLKELFKKNYSSGHNNGYVFIGFRDYRNGESWRTVKGQSLVEAGFENWASGEPNNPGTENCGSMHNDGFLNDVNCKQTLMFICEKTAEYRFL